MTQGYNGRSASWREEDGRQNAVVGMSGRVYDLILVEQPEKLASIAEATLEDALFESGRPVLMVPKDGDGHLGEVIAIASWVIESSVPSAFAPSATRSIVAGR